MVIGLEFNLSYGSYALRPTGGPLRRHFLRFIAPFFAIIFNSLLHRHANSGAGYGRLRHAVYSFVYCYYYMLDRSTRKRVYGSPRRGHRAILHNGD